MAQSSGRNLRRRKTRRQTERALRTFLLMQQFDAQAIGSRIKQARFELGLNQEDLAAMASFSKRSLQDYENGVTVPYKHFRELSQLLNKRQEWLMYGSDAVTPPDGDLVERLQALPDRLDAVEGDLRDLLELLNERLPHRDAGETGS